MTTRHAAVQVGMDPDGLELELFRPICPDHDPPWRGPSTFNVDTAKHNARVHDTDQHREEPPA